jgi:hypothetical protein
LSIASIDADKAAIGDNAVEGTAVNNQVSNNGKCRRSPGFDVDLVSVLEEPHVELARCGSLQWTMWSAVDDHATGTAYAFSAIVIKCHGLFAASNQRFIQYVEHLKEAHVFAYAIKVVGLEHALNVGSGLAPDMQSQVHYL